MNNSFEVVCGNCLNVMGHMADNCIDLIVADPPYNIGKADWDKIPNYIDWLGSVILELQRMLKDNGSFYIFHNSMPTISRLMLWIEKNTKFVFKQFIVWNKKFEGDRNEGYLQGFIELNSVRNYQQMAEYILFYTFQDDTGLTRVKLDLNNFTPLRKYFRDFQQALNMNIPAINRALGHRKAEHAFYWNSSQWKLPTLETYAELCRLPLKHEFVRHEYEDLRHEYEDLRYTFNNQKTHHSVWNYPIADRTGHITPKPVDLIRNIILHSSNPNDLVLDPFCGSGSTGCAAVMEGRKFIGIELNVEYCALAEDRIMKESNQ